MGVHCHDSLMEIHGAWMGHMVSIINMTADGSGSVPEWKWKRKRKRCGSWKQRCRRKAEAEVPAFSDSEASRQMCSPAKLISSRVSDIQYDIIIVDIVANSRSQ
jgi:hypothetical protein